MEAPRWIHDDGQTRAALPSRFARRSDGTWSVPTAETAAEFGWHPVAEVERPSADPWDTVTVEVVHDGTGFVQQWTVVQGVAPLINPAEFPPEDERIAADALLTEDSVGYRAVIGLLIQKGVLTEAEVAAAQAAALQRLTVLADRPDIRRQMMAERIARAEAARG